VCRLSRPCRGSYKADNWGKQVSSVREVVKKKSVGREPPVREGLNVEAEESPLLGAVTRERLVKLQQAAKYFSVLW
jgi:hypothetical protein